MPSLHLPCLDHIILFVPPSPTNPSTPRIPPCISANFTLTPGGVHGDGLTANTLVLLGDGSYIELICFVGDDPSAGHADDQQNQDIEDKISQHWWGGPNARQKVKGCKDWCLTTLTSTAHENYNNHLSKLQQGNTSAYTYAPPIPGSRLRPDGVSVKWHVTFPSGANGGQGVRGLVPFWCHDVGSRALRVPVAEDKVRHASGVSGVRRFTVLVASEGVLGEVRGLYEGLFGAPEVPKEGGGGGGMDEVACVFRLGRVRRGDDGEEGEGPNVVLRLARTDGEKKKCVERGFWFGDVVFAARADDKVEGRRKGLKVRIDGGEGEDEGLGGLWVEYV